MARRANHYEGAFESYLRSRQVPYVAVNEAKRSLMADASLKNLDFIISPGDGASFLVDVKGRLFPSGTDQKRYWTNWSTRDDLKSLAQWEQLFGERFAALFVFAYQVRGRRAPVPSEKLFEWRGETYGFIGIRLREYVPHARLISPKWDTVAMPTRLFRRYAEPVDLFF